MDGVCRPAGEGSSTVAGPPVMVAVKKGTEVHEVTLPGLDATVGDLKVALQELTGYAPGQQKLISNGKTLKDDQTVGSYNLAGQPDAASPGGRKRPGVFMLAQGQPAGQGTARGGPAGAPGGSSPAPSSGGGAYGVAVRRTEGGGPVLMGFL